MSEVLIQRAGLASLVALAAAVVISTDRMHMTLLMQRPRAGLLMAATWSHTIEAGFPSGLTECQIR